MLARQKRDFGLFSKNTRQNSANTIGKMGANTMRVLIVNTVCGTGSVGRICVRQKQALEQQGHTVKIAYGRGTGGDYRIDTPMEVRAHGLLTRTADRHGFGSCRATERFLEWAERFDPDMLLLHNLHGYYLHIGLLFQWIKSRPRMQVRWSLHDCWAFTGHCTYFDYVDCPRWKTGCHHCPQKTGYPASYGLDRSRENYRDKRALFTGVPNMTLITPSYWLAGLVKESFLKDYPVEVVHNTIDTSVFKPTPGDFRQKHGLEEKKIVLGVAANWEKRKGLQDLLTLSETLGEPYRVVLVGLRGKVPPGVLAIPRTDSPRELAEVYTAADVFVNPTYEDNYPTVNLEAAACGTPVITYRTGGSVESVPQDRIVEKGDLRGLEAMIRRVCGV